MWLGRLPPWVVSSVATLVVVSLVLFICISPSCLSVCRAKLAAANRTRLPPMRGVSAVKDGGQGGVSPGLHKRSAEGWRIPWPEPKGILDGGGGESPKKR